MKVSMGRFDGGETILFIKPDNALELSAIAHKLSIKLKEIDPEPVEAPRARRKGYTRVDSANKKQTCYYCGSKYSVKRLRSTAWRNFCKTKKCRLKYSQDRTEYQRDPGLYKRREATMAQRRQLADNIADLSGLKVTLSNR